MVLGVFLTGCSPKSTSDATPLDSKLFSAVQVIGSRGVAPGQFNKPSKCNLLALKTIHDVSLNES